MTSTSEANFKQTQLKFSNQKHIPLPVRGFNMTVATRFFGLAAIGLALVFAPTTAEAVVVIDTFDVGQVVSDNSADGIGVPGSAAGAGIIGTNRDLYVEKTLPPLTGGSIEARDEAVDGTFSVDRGSGVGGNVLISWDGVANPPSAFNPTSNLAYMLGAGSGVDLTQGGSELGILIRIVEADVVGQTLTVTLFTDAGNYSAQTYVVGTTAPPGFDAQLPWGGFAGVVGSANPAQVRAITLAIAGPTGSDLTIDLLQTYAPEPASAGMLGLGFVATIARVRRRRNPKE